MGNQFSKSSPSGQDEQEGLGKLSPELTFPHGVEKFLWETCTKHPGHKNFIPAKQFTKEHLPAKYQNENIFEKVKIISDLTVRVIVGYTSNERPDNDDSSSMRGKKVGRLGRFGSGFVFKVQRPQKSTTQDVCVCQEHDRSCKQRQEVGKVFVKTANHVVFDNSEAEETIAELFYDDEEDTSNVKKLYGSQVIQSDLQDDWCVFECLTDDEDLINKLSGHLKKLDQLDESLDNELSDSSVEPAITSTSIAPQPHRCSKQMSIEKLVGPRTTQRPPRGNILSNNPPLQIKFFENKMYIKLDFDLWEAIHRWPIVNGKPEEAQPTGIGINVTYPDNTEQESTVWQLDRSVKETKLFLLNTGGIQDSQQNLRLVIDLPNGKTTEMEDTRQIKDYWDDLTRAIKLRFEK